MNELITQFIHYADHYEGYRHLSWCVWSNCALQPNYDVTSQKTLFSRNYYSWYKII